MHQFPHNTFSTPSPPPPHTHTKKKTKKKKRTLAQSDVLLTWTKYSPLIMNSEDLYQTAQQRKLIGVLAEGTHLPLETSAPQSIKICRAL